MSDTVRQTLSAADIKSKARELGAHLVGIADGEVMDQNPPDLNNLQRPSNISELDSNRVIVLGLHANCGTGRLPGWNDQHRFYNDELTLTALEEIALNLVFWLEDHACQSIVIPANMVDTEKPNVDPTAHQAPVLSLDHAAVEAGLGTLGLNQQILTPEFGPRVKLISVLTSADVEADKPMVQALCKGPECGRCLAACPADAVGNWQRDWDACDSYRMPYGFKPTMEFLEKLLKEPEMEAKIGMLRSEDSYSLWTGIMRGAGVVTGCRRCQDVCPVGNDYEDMIGEVLDEIAEHTSAKSDRLAGMLTEGTDPSMRRWVGESS